MKLSRSTKMSWFVRGMSLLRIPLLAFCWPKVTELSSEKSTLTIPLNYRTKNHLGAMYFGALVMGAEAVIALHVLEEIDRGNKVSFLFKEFHSNFIKRAEGDVTFSCVDGLAIRDMVKKAIETKERQNGIFKSVAKTPSLTGTENIAEFELTLSIKAV